jgi:uncharacterized protein with FMN-binding domain
MRQTKIKGSSGKGSNLLLFVLLIAGRALSGMAFFGCAGYGTAPPPAAAAGMERNGLYEGAALGWRGPVRVLLRLEDGRITEIEIIDHGDDQFIGGAAMEELLELVLAYNTTDLDAVSGATESSEGFLAAVEDALAREAGNRGLSTE